MICCPITSSQYISLRTVAVRLHLGVTNQNSLLLTLSGLLSPTNPIGRLPLTILPSTTSQLGCAMEDARWLWTLVLPCLQDLQIWWTSSLKSLTQSRTAPTSMNCPVLVFRWLA